MTKAQLFVAYAAHVSEARRAEAIAREKRKAAREIESELLKRLNKREK